MKPLQLDERVKNMAMDHCARCGAAAYPWGGLTFCQVEICGAGPFCKLCRQSHWDRVHDMSPRTVADGSRGMQRGPLT